MTTETYQGSQEYLDLAQKAGPHSRLGKFYRRVASLKSDEEAYFNQFRSHRDFEPKTVTDSEWLTRAVELPQIHKALETGARLHVFSSGGGLRVVSVSQGDAEIGYGESPFFDDALVLADKDLEVGGKPYGDVYGKEYPHFFTGSSKPSSHLDEFILRGNKLDASKNGAEVEVKISGYQDVDIPTDVTQEVLKTGIPALFSDRGFTYMVSRIKFASDEDGTSMQVVGKDKDNKRDPFFYPTIKVGRGSTFDEAATSALKSTPVEE
jgi:hypothetical protein